MPQLRIGLRDLEGLPSGSLELKGPNLEKWVREYFSFLPHPLGVEFAGDEVVLTYPDETDAAQAEAARLAGKAARRAAEGNYDKPIGIYKRVTESERLKIKCALKHFDALGIEAKLDFRPCVAPVKDYQPDFKDMLTV